MSVVLPIIIVAVALPLGGYALLYWLLADTREEHRPPAPKRLIISLWDAVIWNAVTRWWDRPLQLTYRRDRRGRFRKIG